MTTMIDWFLCAADRHNACHMDPRGGGMPAFAIVAAIAGGAR
jgi:hypothetical protein